MSDGWPPLNNVVTLGFTDRGILEEIARSLRVIEESIKHGLSKDIQPSKVVEEREVED